MLTMLHRTPLRVKITPVPDIDLRPLLSSWQLHLRSERKSPRTLDAYTMGVTQFFAYCDRENVPLVLDHLTVKAFVADLLDRGAEASTAVNRLSALRRFSAWLTDEGELDRDDLVGVKRPKVDNKVVPRLTDDECTALVNACKGKTFRDRRDEAIVRIMLETTVRAGEVCGMNVDDVNLQRGLLIVRGKGGKERFVPFGPQTALSIDRYLRMRRSHRDAASPALWLGGRGDGRFRYHGLYCALEKRAEAAGIEHFHPHLTRHTASQRWLAAGGSEGGLMAIAGWSRRDMLDRYTQATASDRAANEARGLNLGDL